MADIGATLREARLRARIDLSEIEAQTKIRARYLRALENEEWDVLPGPTFVRTFLRTYAEALGLDPKPLVEQYRLASEHPGEHETQPLVAPQRRGARAHRENGDAGERSGSSRGYALAVGGIVVVIVVLLVALLTRGGAPKGGERARRLGHSADAGRHSTHAATRRRRHAAGSGGRVTLALQASSTVWVCLVNAREQKLIPGVELLAGETSGPYRGSRFRMVLGNDAVKLTVDGRTVTPPESSAAIGYEVDGSGARTISAASEPSCS
ncbi:MAG: helix-turn-helix domain-containing protein [Solirubrobacteraceae bacterium]